MPFNPSDKQQTFPFGAVLPSFFEFPRDRSFQMPFFKPMNAFLFVLLFSSSIACIGFGGCLLEYPHGGCATSVTGYVAHCYGGYCRKNKAKGLRMMAMNEFGGKAGEREKGHERTDDKQHNSRQEQTNDDQFTPLEVSPDTLFLECCQSWSLPPSCLPKCSYTNYTAEMLRSMFFRSDDCPIESASIIHFCASQNLDHSLCCRQNGILTTRSGEKCLIFCEQLPKNETRLDLSYVPCFERFAEMKKCFYESALRTIDYLEAEFDQLKNDDKLNEERGEGLKTSTEENERAETENGGKDTFTIAKPPIIFVNDHTMKHPNINDNFTPTEGKRKRWNKNGEEQMKREAKKERKREE